MAEKTPRLRPYQIRPPVVEVWKPLPLTPAMQRKAGQISFFDGAVEPNRDLAEVMELLDNQDEVV